MHLSSYVGGPGGGPPPLLLPARLPLPRGARGKDSRDEDDNGHRRAAGSQTREVPRGKETEWGAIGALLGGR